MRSLPVLVPLSVALALGSLAAQGPIGNFHGVAYDSARARTVLFGGMSPYGYLYSDTWEFDGDTWTWMTTSLLWPPARRAHGLVYDAARVRTVMFGGMVANGLAADTWEYDGSQWQQVATPSAPSPRALFGLAYDCERQRSVLFGGAGPGPLGDTWEYDGVNWTQTQPTTAPSPRVAAKMVFDAARRCTVLFGGQTWSSPTTPALLGDTWEYAQGQWRSTTQPVSPSARYHHAMAYDSSRLCIVMAGGVTANGSVDDAWEFDGATWSQSATALPSARVGHTLAYEPVTGRRILIGEEGFDSHGTWESDGGPWGQVEARILDQTGHPWHWDTLQPATSPGARAAPSIVHDSTRHRTVIWGGVVVFGGPRLTDTWEFDGSAWSQVMTANSPQGEWLYQAPAVFDTARNRTVLVASYYNTSLLQTWEYDGVDWTLHPTATAPSAPGVMTYDIARARSVFVTNTQTWEYNGVDWQLAAAASPMPYVIALTYDAHRQRAVLFGYDYSGGPQATWEYDGTAWVEFVVIGGPFGVGSACFDVSREKVILAAGSQTWEYDGASFEYLTSFSPPRRCVLVYDQVLQRPVAFGGEDMSSIPPVLLDTTLVLQPPTPPIPPLATWVRHGAGCPGSGGTPDLGTLGNAIPAMGSTFVWQLSGLPTTNNLALLSFGFGISRYQGHALPLALDQVGLPACQLWIEPQDGLYATLPNSGGLVLYGFRIPNAPALAGQVLNSQAVVLDPLAASGIDSVSNAGIMQVR